MKLESPDPLIPGRLGHLRWGRVPQSAGLPAEDVSMGSCLKE